MYTINQEEELLRIVDFWQPIPDGKKPQQANHLIIGAEYWISTGNTVSLETYYKSYSSIYDLNPAPDYSNIEETFALVVSSLIIKFFLFLLIIFSMDFPIEPVDPKIIISFFI